MHSLLAKGLIGLLLVVLAAVTISFGTVILQTYREYRHLQTRESALRVELQALRREQAQREEYLRLMLEDPSFLERVVREKLGYVRPDETVFLFDDPRRSN
ncbi:MAG: FtsB family cell division protein [Opitutales bacterium]